MSTYALFYDTETTGLPLFKEPSEHPGQPHLVQLAALLVDLEMRSEIASMDVIVRPDGWIIPDEVSAIHGITTEHAHQVGVSEENALGLFMELAGRGLRVAHNETFDARIMRIALMRYCGEKAADEWKERPAACTANLSLKRCALPPTDRMKACGRFGHKTPKLSEAYRHFFGRDFENAHSAIADVKACRDVYFAIQDLG